MSKMATEAAGMCNDFVDALEALKSQVLKACPQQHDDLRLAFSDLRMRAGQIKAHVTAACVAADVKELPTLAEIQRGRQEPPQVPACPDRPLAPPPKFYVQGLND